MHVSFYLKNPETGLYKIDNFKVFVWLFYDYNSQEVKEKLGVSR